MLFRSQSKQARDLQCKSLWRLDLSPSAATEEDGGVTQTRGCLRHEAGWDLKGESVQVIAFDFPSHFESAQRQPLPAMGTQGQNFVFAMVTRQS